MASSRLSLSGATGDEVLREEDGDVSDVEVAVEATVGTKCLQGGCRRLLGRGIYQTLVSAPVGNYTGREGRAGSRRPDVGPAVRPCGGATVALRCSNGLQVPSAM